MHIKRDCGGEGGVTLTGDTWSRTTPCGHQLATQLRDSCWTHQEVLNRWASRTTLSCKKGLTVVLKKLSTCACFGWIRHIWVAVLLCESVIGHGLAVRCSNVVYWCAENNQLNTAPHYQLFAFTLTTEQILRRWGWISPFPYTCAALAWLGLAGRISPVWRRFFISIATGLPRITRLVLSWWRLKTAPSLALLALGWW